MRHCCIKAKGTVAVQLSGAIDPSGTFENYNKPGILRLAAGPPGGRLEEIGWADHSMQQCPQNSEADLQRLCVKGTRRPVRYPATDVIKGILTIERLE